MESQPLTPARATLQLALLNAEAISVDSSDIFAWLRDADLPSEAAMRLSGLVDATREIGGKVISIGRIVLLKIIEFVKAHPNLTTGIAVGAAIGALVNPVPLLGTYLASVCQSLSISNSAARGNGSASSGGRRSNPPEAAAPPVSWVSRTSITSGDSAPEREAP